MKEGLFPRDRVMLMNLELNGRHNPVSLLAAGLGGFQRLLGLDQAAVSIAGGIILALTISVRST